MFSKKMLGIGVEVIHCRLNEGTHSKAETSKTHAIDVGACFAEILT